MSRLTRIQKYILIMMAVVFVGVLGYSGWNSNQQTQGVVQEGQGIVFSKDSGFYAENIMIELRAAKGDEIYYTLDGSPPTLENPSACKYEEGISLETAEGENTCTLRAAAYEKGVPVTDVVSKTYLLGTNINNRYSMPVLCVSGNPDDFYNYEDGIMVHGKLDEEYKAANPQFKEAFDDNRVPVYGNYYQTGRNAEKEVEMTLFDKEGTLLLSQSCGFRVYGAMSRMKNQPSFRLYARSEYDEVLNDFEYTFFPDQYTAENTVQADYKRVIVRNSGNDNGYGFIRSELATRIAKEAGVKDTPSASPVCVYLNGQYYGVHWFISNFDDSYFRESYGEYPGEMYVFEGKVQELDVEGHEDDSTYVALLEEYNEIMALLGNADLTREENWQKLNSFMDVDNFLRYTAIQHYVSNQDSLFHNYRVYRYYSPTGEYMPGTVFDGKFRLLLFDMDFALGLIPQWSYVEPETYTLTAERIDGNEPYEKLFSNILKREDCRQQYLRYTLSMMNYYYSENHVKTVLEEMHNSRSGELYHMILNSEILRGNYEAPEIGDMDYIAHQMFLIERYANLRPEYAKTDLQLAFGEMKEYTLCLENPTQASITLDYATLSEPVFTGSYFEEIPLEIAAAARPGYEFSYWLVNGQEIGDEIFTVDASMISEGQLNLTCVCAPAENADLGISGIKSVSGDYVEITNFSAENKNLAEYCLTDNSSYKKSVLPDSILLPGETVTIYCKNYAEVEALGKPVTNFNIKAGETVSLCRTDGSGVDSVTVPKLGSDKGVWRMDRYTGEFREEINEKKY